MKNKVKHVDDSRYDDIADLPHFVSRRHSPMPRHDRAAQFSPFAALTGHSDAIEETARLTENRPETDENTFDMLNERFRAVRENIKYMPDVTVTYFVADEKKSGGAYVTFSGRVMKIDEYAHLLVMEGGRCIPAADIVELSGEFFGKNYTEYSS